MFEQMEKAVLTLPIDVKERSFETASFGNNNNSLIILSEFNDVLTSEVDPNYEQFLADIWVGIVLTLIVLSCICCMCSCLLYHKFQQWKRSVLQDRPTAANVENGNPECESLPSYTIVSGLPSYEEALEQLKKVKELRTNSTKGEDNVGDVWVPHTPPTPMARLSVSELFQFYKNPVVEPTTTASKS